MTRVMMTHEVDDVAHWLASPKRAEVFGPLGITLELFTDPEGGNTVGIVGDVPDMDALNALLKSAAGAEAMTHDGVRPDTIRMFIGV